MKVVSRISLKNHLAAELQKIAHENGTCHYGDYKQWCIRGEDLEKALDNLFEYKGIFEPTRDLIQCKECKYWQDNNDGYPHKECRWGKDETPDATDYCSYAERIEGE